MSAHHEHAGGIPAGQPRNDVDDVHHRSVRMAAHPDHRLVVFDTKAAAAIEAVLAELAVQITPCRADSAPRAQRIAHGVTRAECNERGIGLANSARGNVRDGRGNRGIAPETHARVESWWLTGALLWRHRGGQ